MAAPSVTGSVNDPGMGTVDPATSIPLVYGPASAGTANVITAFASIPELVATHGQGQGVECAARILAKVGGPIFFMKSATSVAASNGAVTPTRVGTSTGTVTVAGTANDDYEVQISIKATGTLGAGTFQYSLDDGRTWSETITIPAGGTYALTNTGLTLTFVPGAGPTYFEVGDLHEFDSVAAMWNTTDLSAGVTAILADPSDFDFLVCAGRHADGATAAGVVAALGTHATSLANQNRPVRILVDGGKDNEATTKSAFAATTSKSVAVCYSTYDVPSAKPMVGWGAPMRPTVNYFASLAAANLISTDLAFCPAGPPEDDVLAIGYDEFRKALMDDAKFSTMRTWQGEQGFFPCNCRLISPMGSDFEFWQHGRIVDASFRQAYKSLRKWSSAGLRAKADKTLYEPDALRVEKSGQADQETLLSNPTNVLGVKGHVSVTDDDPGVAFRISRTEQILSTKKLVAEVALRPLAYAKTITFQVGLAANISG